MESIEDHGFLVDIGVTGTKAFLPKVKTKNEAKALKRGRTSFCVHELRPRCCRPGRIWICDSRVNTFADLKVGQYVTAVLEEVKSEGRVVRLSVNPAAINQVFADPQHGWTLNNLTSGLLVKATVKKVNTHHKVTGAFS